MKDELFYLILGLLCIADGCVAQPFLVAVILLITGGFLTGYNMCCLVDRL